MILNVEDNPKTFGKVMSSKDIVFWKKAVNNEMNSILSNNTWILIDLPSASKLLRCKYVFRREHDTNDFIQTFKAILVVKGFT
jgi:hypothetical protein